MTITALPTAPSRTQDADTFNTNADAWVAALPTFVTEANALAAALNSIAAGTAYAIPYTFSTTTTDADPGAGYLRLDNATQNLATTIRADLAGADGSTWTDVLATFDDSTSTIKGHIMLQKLADATKWILFSVSALASPSGYKNITVAVVAASAASPFANNDSVILKFTRTGDKGETGAAADAPGLILIGSPITASGASSVDIETTFDSTYAEYELRVSGLTASTVSLLMLRMKISGAYDTGANYSFHSSRPNSGASTYVGVGASGTTGITIHNNGWNGAGNSMDLVIRIHSPASTTLKKKVDWSGSVTEGASAVASLSGAGLNTGTGALTGIRLYPDAGTVSGTFRLYGLKNS